MMTCDLDKLTELVRGELEPDEARKVEAHAAGCAECARELAWVRAEARLFAERSRPSVPAHAWQGVERRLVMAREARRHQRRAWVGAGALGTFAAAAVTLLAMWRSPVGPRVATLVDAGAPAAEAPPAALALDRAEAEYKQAIGVLEVEWQTRRASLPPERVERVDGELTKLKDLVTENAKIAGADVDGRRRALRTYSAYMRTMQAAVLEDEQ